MIMVQRINSNYRSLHPEAGFAMTYSQPLTVIARRLCDEAIRNS